jgi:uncharacterized lipoprotein YddW (UPF0748 family)
MRFVLLLVLLLAACGGPPSGPTPVSPAEEARALWVSRFEYASPTDIDSIIARAARTNFNVIFFQVRGAGEAFYDSAIEPCAVALCGSLGNGRPSWDPLARAVASAHARGIELHAWINALSGWSAGSAASCTLLQPSAAGSPDHMLIAHPEWRVVNAAGSAQPCPDAPNEYVYLSPGIPAVRTHLARVAADIVRRYAVDGIHLDRIRYPGQAWSYDTTSLQAFGKDPAAFAADWAQFRREQVALAVRETFDSVRSARPSAALSAAVWGIWQDRWGWNSSHGFGQYFQDPRAWVAAGSLDVAVPMTYYAIATTPCGFADWACLLDDHLVMQSGSSARHVYIGIAASRGTAQVLQQIELGRRRGVKGFALYSYSSVTAEMRAALASGPFALPASVPPREWQ